MRTKEPGTGTNAGAIVRWVWVTASIAALLFAMVVFDRDRNRDIDVMLLWVMMALSFPASVVCAMFYGAILFGLESLFAIQVSSGRGEMVATWLGMLAAGYFQWFYAVPYAWDRFRRLSRAGR